MRLERTRQAEQQIISPRRLSRAVAKIFCWGLLGALGCASRGPAPAPIAPPAAAPSAGLRVELLWSEPVDLDLYVTDPTQETIYFANPRSRGGARLERDVSCEDVVRPGEAPPWTESVGWGEPARGRYRVGVDFIDECEGDVERSRRGGEVGFRILVDSDGHREEKSGSLAWNRFEPVVVEFDVPGKSDESRSSRETKEAP